MRARSYPRRGVLVIGVVVLTSIVALVAWRRLAPKSVVPLPAPAAAPVSAWEAPVAMTPAPSAAVPESDTREARGRQREGKRVLSQEEIDNGKW
jgi:hypothetical protein